MRCIPVGLNGVSAKTTFADAYFNTPLEFWVHDMNHNRRFASYNRRYFEKHGITEEKEKVEHYEEFHRTITEKILPEIVVKKSMTQEEKNIAHSGERERSFWSIVNTFTPLSIASFNF